MKNSCALTILKVEGLGDLIDCQIFQDNSLLKSISLQETQINENFTEFSKKGVLSLIVKNPSKPCQKHTISMKIEALPLEGTVWLPLYSNSSGEVLPSIPSTLPSTRVLISINTLSLLTPVLELNESDGSVFEMENSLNKGSVYENKILRLNYDKCRKALRSVNEKNKELRILYCELQNRFDRDREDEKNEGYEAFTNIAVQLERQKSQCSNLQCINEENAKRIKNLETMLESEMEQRKNTENELKVLFTESKEYFESSEQKIKHYEETLQHQSEEIDFLKASKAFSVFEKLAESSQKSSTLQHQLQITLEKLQESEISRNILQTKLESSAQFFSNQLSDLLQAPNDSISNKFEECLKELKKYRIKCAELENLLDDKYLDIKIRNGSRSAKIIDELKEQLKNQKKINEGLLEQAREKHCKEISNGFKGADEKFVEYLKNFSIDEKFSRVSEGVFAYSNKKVSVAVKNGTLVCRVGGGYVGIDQFLKGVGEEISHKSSQNSLLNDRNVKEDLEKKRSDGKFRPVKSFDKEDLEKKSCDEKFKTVKIGSYKKENVAAKWLKGVQSKIFTKSLTPSRDSLAKRAFK